MLSPLFPLCLPPQTVFLFLFLLFTGQQAWLAQPLSLLLHACCSRHQALSFLAARPIWPRFMVREGGSPSHFKRITQLHSNSPKKLFWISSNRCLHPIAFPTHYLIHWPPNQEAASGSLRALHLARSVTCSKWKKQAPYGGLQYYIFYILLLK